MSISRIAVVVGLFCSTTFSSGNLVMIYHALPALLLPYAADSTGKAPLGPPPSHLLQQWKLLFDRGHYTFPGNAILAASAFFYAGRQLSETFYTQKRLYYIAALLDIAVIPFTLILVVPANVELLKREAWARKGIEEKEPRSGTGPERLETVDLIRWWGRLGAIRAGFPLVAIGVAAAAACESNPAALGSLSTESASLALGTAAFIFMVLCFGQPVVKV